MIIKSIITRTLSLAMAAAIATTAGFAQETPPPSATATTLPVQRTLTDTTGRKIDVTITEKTATAIKAKRVSDGKEFSFELAKLSADDQAFVTGVVAAPVKKPTVLLVSKNDKIQTLLEKAGFDVTLPLTTNSVKEPDGQRVASAIIFLEKLPDDELKKFDIIWANEWTEGWMTTENATLNNGRTTRQADRVLNLVATGKLVVWNLYWKSSRKKLLAKEYTDHGLAITKEYMQSEENVISYNWEIRKWDAKTGSNPVVETHPEILDQVIAEAKKLSVTRP